ncbi:unnamed protein product [Rhizoctonia solani]|uniref:Uncharacterized protein n=1 Tax=Rhizoctonia solani TaxID=456999 RepID=A0A8H3GSC3_9AGAM|nr:unnamed protein product [Rhizoctonia solani]
MTRAHSTSTSSSVTYSPPPLPEYLSTNHTLNVIVGVPKDEEVKAIHDTIRAVNSVSNFPALYDHKLCTQLAQYLFTVQMAVYRNEYPSSIFPEENTYVPPPIPSHISTSLEPVVGAPSDAELESAYGVVRAMENLANSPFFDPVLTVKLSQHFFNIQFARYMQDANQGQFTQRQPNGPPLPLNENEPLTIIPGDISDVANQQAIQYVEPTEIDSEFAPRSNDKLDKLCTLQHETNCLLRGNEELLRNIRQTLVGAHSKGNRFNQTGSCSSYHTINEKGEFPWMHCLEDIYSLNGSSLNRFIVEKELVAYLKFYDIGAYLIEEETGNLKPDKQEDAKKALAYFLYYCRPLES